MLKKRSKNLAFNLHKNKSNPYLYYTDFHINSIKRIVRGALLAITQPVLCTAIINQCSIDEKEFFSEYNIYNYKLFYNQLTPHYFIFSFNKML